MAVKVAVLGAANRFTEVVRAFIRKTYRDAVLVGEDQAEVCIIDLDAYGATELLQDQRQRFPDRPVIALSLHDSGEEGVIWLKKPLSAEALAKALDQVRDSKPSLKLVVREQAGGAIHQAAAGIAKKNRAAAIHVRHNWAEDTSSGYNPNDCLQGWLTKAYRQAMLTGMPLRLETGWQPILVFPKVQKVWVDADDKQLHAFCRIPLKTFSRLNGARVDLPIGIHPEPAAALAELPQPLQAMDAFLWKVAWWNSGGRLPTEIRSTQVVRLKRWPNLTRYLCSPQALRLSAFLYQRPASPLQAAKLLGLALADVFSFVSAANAVELIEQISVSSESRSELPAPSKNPSLLRRILQRLVKG